MDDHLHVVSSVERPDTVERFCAVGLADDRSAHIEKHAQFRFAGKLVPGRPLATFDVFAQRILDLNVIWQRIVAVNRRSTRTRQNAPLSHPQSFL